MCPIFNAATFQTFLKRLLRQQTPGPRMLLVLDNARYHHAKLLAPYLRSHARDLRLLFLPPYSPQLPQLPRSKLTRRLATHRELKQSLE
jgi:transposase